MSTLSFVNVTAWDVDQVFSWIKGLPDSCAQYADLFKDFGVNGKRLQSLDYSQLEKMKIWKFGHQEEILQSIRLLEALSFDLEHDTLSVIALRLDCQARNLCNSLKSLLLARSKEEQEKKKTVNLQALVVEVLAGVSDVVDTIKSMIPWFERIPFDDSDYLNCLKKQLLQHASDLIKCSKCDDKKEIQTSQVLCDSITSICGEIIMDSDDPLIIQTANLEIVTLHRNSEEPLGMAFVTSFDHVHTVAEITAGSVADNSKKIDSGDEIIQINYETVVGWEFHKLEAKFNDSKKDVTLILKKKPRHMTLSGYQKKKPQKKQLPSLVEGEFRRKMANAKSQSRRRNQHQSTVTNGSISEQDANDHISDSEVFSSTVEFTEPNNNDSKLRRATVSGGSPVLSRAVVGSMENISSSRPRSYYPVSTNIPIIPIDFHTKPLANIQQPSSQGLSDSNLVSSAAAAPSASGVRSPVSRHASRKSSESASEVAGGDEPETAPRLLRLTKLDSTKRTETREQQRYESVSSLDSVLSVGSVGVGSQVSSTTNLKQHFFRSERDLSSPSPSGVLRKNLLRKTRINRRISCKDLGGGDCQGWLWKKKDGTGLKPGHWKKCWFVLKKKELYYYNDPEDLKAQGVIHLPGFIVSPSNESRSKKYAFKAYNSTGTVFYFAAERQDDMAKWMNKIGLASLANLDTSHLRTTAGFMRPLREGYTSIAETTDYHLPDFSESDEEIISPFKENSGSSCASSVAGSREDLTSLYRHIRAADLDLSGANVKTRRSTILGAATLDKDSATKNEAVCRLLSLKRTLKDKEQTLAVLNELLCKQPITAFHLIHFKVLHPSIMEEMGISVGLDDDKGSQMGEGGEQETKGAAGGRRHCSNFSDSESFA